MCVAPAGTAPLLSKRAEIYQAGLQTKGAASSTKGEARFVLDLLVELIGDKPVNEVDADDILKFQRAIAFWPVNIGRRKDFKEMKKLDVIKRGKAERLPRIDRTTQGRHMKTLITFFNACQRSRQLTANPCDSFSLKDFKDRIFRKKDRFSDDDLATLFDPAKAQELTHPLLYWGPMIELYSSMRVNEVAQLFLEDVQCMEFMEKGVKRRIHFFNITDSGEGQHVKSGYSLRGMPIHSKLLDLGFLEYVEDVKKTGAKHLFPGLSWNDNRPGKTLSDWFNKNHLRKVCGIEDRRKTLHCFRHTTNTLADRSQVSKGVMRSINGHSDGSDIDDRYYVTRATLSEAQEGLEKIDYPTLNLLPYAPGRFDEYLRHAVAQDNLFANLIKEGKPLPRRAGWSSKATSAMSSKSKGSKAKASVAGPTPAANLSSGPSVEALLE
ncbi:hypothetical protein B5P43_10390 [Bacillus sp. SRB_336]|nr:hypothetical protein B5P43_10390 [Bacillus sp. SRB_336]